MKVTLGKDGLSKTWQDDFPKTTHCRCCGGECRIAFVAHEALDEDDRETDSDKKKFLCDMYQGKEGMWLHDCCAVAVYFCKKCLNPMALYNQG